MWSERLEAWKARLLVGRGATRQRLPRDAVGLVLGAVLATFGWLAVAGGASHPVRVDVPPVISWLVVVLAAAGTWVFLLLALGLCVLVGRWGLAVRVVATAGVAALGCVAVAHALGTGQAGAPSLLAATFAVAVLAIRTLAAPIRIWWWGLVVIGAVASVFVDHLVPLGALAAVGLGVLAGATVSLAFGTLGGGTTAPEVPDLLRQLGVDATVVGPATRPPTWGVVRFEAVDPSGAPLDVDVYGRDAPEGQFLARLWRFLWLRRSTLDLRLRRTDHVQHAMGLMLWANDRGVGAPEVVAVGRIAASDEVVLVARRPPGTRLVDLTDDGIPAGLVGASWQALDRLHDAQVVLDAVRPDTIVVDAAGEVAFCEFSRAEAMAGPEDCRRDDAALLVALSRTVGPERAVRQSIDAVGPDRLGGLLPLVQPQVLSAGSGSRPSSSVRKELTALREEGAIQLGIEPVEPVPLARVQVAKVVMVVFTFFGLWLLVQQLLGLGEIRGVLAGAIWAWIVATLVITQATSLTEAVSLSGAVTADLPILPLTLLRFAMGFTGMVGGTVATTATVVRFFQRHGLDRAVALSSGVIYSVSGFIVQIVLTLVALVVARGDLHFEREGSSGSKPEILQLVLWGIVALGVIAAVAFAVPRIRRLVVDRARPHAEAAWRNLRNVASRPDRIARLFVGAATTQIMMAVGLGFALRSVGSSAPLGGLILVCTFTALIGGMAPVPGGMGVMEASYISGLTLLGVPEDLAVSATLIYRAATTYLPPLWGWGAMVWLRRHDDL